MKKRLVAIALAMVMTMGMSATVFADPIETTSGSQNVSGQAEVKTPVIKVTVPTSFEITVNPYSIPVKLDGKEVNDEILNPVSYIASYSDVPVVVTVSDATAKSATAANVAIVSEIPENETAKKAALQLKVTAATYSKNAWVTGDTADISAKFVPAVESGPSTFATVNAVVGNEEKFQITLAPANVVSKVTANLADSKLAEVKLPTIDETTMIQTEVKAGVPAASGKEGLKDQETVTTTPSVAALKITGDVVAQPIKDEAPDEWNNTGDKLTVVVKFDFQAIPVEAGE